MFFVPLNDLRKKRSLSMPSSLNSLELAWLSAIIRPGPVLWLDVEQDASAGEAGLDLPDAEGPDLELELDDGEQILGRVRQQAEVAQTSNWWRVAWAAAS